MDAIFKRFVNRLFSKVSIFKTQEWQSLRIVLFSLSFLIAVSIGLTVAYSESNKRRSVIELININNDNFHQLISIHARAYNYSVIEILSQNLLLRDEVEFIEVIDDIGFVVFDNRIPEASVENHENTIEFRKPLLLSDNTFSEKGHVLIGYQIPALSQVIIDAMKNTLLMYLVIFMSTIVILTYYVNKFVSRPIAHLTDSIRESRRTKTHVTTELGGNTKLGRLAEEYNAMQTELNQYREDNDRFRKLIMLGTVVGGVAHEFNNILAVILSSVDMIKLENSESTNLNKRLDLIESAAHNATDIVSKLLTKKTLNRQAVEVFELAIIFDDIKELGSSFYDPSRIRLDIDYSENFYIRCHKSEFLTAIINLIKNAAQAMHETGGEISVTCRNPGALESQYHMAPKGDFCVLTVADNGPGVAKHLQDRLFEPFFTTKSQGQGTGLGLWCVYELITSIGGFVFYSDNTPTGAVITLYLPTVPREPVQENSPSTQIIKDASLSNISILLVEDEQNLIKNIEQYLRARGANVDSAYNCEDALTIIQQKSFDVIVCDLTLPDGDGVKVCGFAKSINADTITILISGNPFSIDNDKNPFDFVYTKPVPLSVLSTIIYNKIKL